MNLSKIISVGVGCAHLEYNIKRTCPTLHLTCTDFSLKSIQLLKEVFLECDSIQEFDMRNEEWNLQEDALYLLHRVNTEFDDKQWKTIFSNMSGSNIKYVLFVPSDFLTWRIIVNEKRTLLMRKIKRKRITFAGYLRTKDTFRTLWFPHYKIVKELSVGKLTGFQLEKR